MSKWWYIPGYALLASAVFISIPGFAQIAHYQNVEAFVSEALATNIEALPKASRLWLSIDDKRRLSELLGRRWQGLRVRYWQQDGTRVWIQNEIGKEYPITAGVAIADGKIRLIKVLEYREIRGGEVRHHFFHRQFVGESLAQKHWGIDGITGATLSVAAMKKMARTALLLDAIAGER